MQECPSITGMCFEEVKLWTRSGHYFTREGGGRLRSKSEAEAAAAAPDACIVLLTHSLTPGKFMLI